MVREVLVLTFSDEGGHARRLSIADAAKNLEGGAVKAAAESIVASGAFSIKGKFTGVIKGQLVATEYTQLFSEV